MSFDSFDLNFKPIYLLKEVTIVKVLIPHITCKNYIDLDLTLLICRSNMVLLKLKCLILAFNSILYNAVLSLVLWWAKNLNRLRI